MRIAVGISNLSTREDAVRRSGIQEVAFQALSALARWDRNTTGIDLIPIFRIPEGNPGSAYDYRLTHLNPSPLVLKESLRELGIEVLQAVERWPHLGPLLDSNKLDVIQKDASSMEAILSADAYFETSLSDTRNSTRWLKRVNKNLIIGHLVHDVGPILFPEYVAEGMNAWFSHQYLECLRGCDYLVSVSRHTALDVETYLPKKPFQFYVSNPTAPAQISELVARQELNTAFGLPAGSRFFLSVATLEPRKNLEHSIRAFLRFRELFSEEFEDVFCVLIGASGWKNEALLQLISNSENHIIRPGFVSTELLSAAFKNASAVLLPSHYEGFGIPISEARACGVPVMTCINSSLPEAAVLDASFVSPTDKDEFAMAMARVLRDSKKSLKPPDFVANMSWDDTLKGWVEATAQVVSHQKTTRSRQLEATRVRTHMRKNTPVVQLDCHNITISRSKLHKTGIQEVSARLFAAIHEANKQLENRIKFEALPVCIPHYKLRGTVPTLTPTFHNWQQLCEELGVSFDALGSNFKQILSGDSAALASTLQSSDWLLLTSQITNKLIPGMAVARASGMKLAYLVHDIIPSVLPHFAPPHLHSWFNEAFIESLREADVIIGNSRHTAFDVEQYLGENTSAQFHWARFPTHQALLSETATEKTLSSNLHATPYFLMLGSTDPRKNVVTVLHAMERFLADNSLQMKPRLVMVGASGWNNEGINSILNRLEEKGLVCRLGYAPDATLSGLLANATALLMPSRYEGFGMPIAQANALGISVLTCSNSSLPEVGLQGNPVFVVPEYPDELFFAMRRLLLNDSGRRNNEKDSSWVELLVRIGHILAEQNR